MSRRVTGSREETLAWRTDQLDDALETGGRELDPQRSELATALVSKVRERWALKGGRTVVALAGATGSGKSTLFNALVGGEVSVIGARRPTTSKATAAIWGGSEDPSELLNWLGIEARHHVPDAAGAESLDGLILVDLPDFDSTEESHRVEADRILERSDVFVWVTDPQKYADARLHNEYLAPLQDHETVMLVVLNQIDRIQEPGGVEKIKADLRQLVAADGAGDFEVIGTSARMRDGLDDLRDAIGAVVERRNAAEQRLVGDLKGTARDLLQDVGDDEPKLDQAADRQLVSALKQAAGVPVVLDAVQRDYLRQAGGHVGWPFTRWVAALRPDPLRRLRLGDNDRPAITPEDVKTALGRSSLPPPSPAARSAVDLATRQVGESAGAGLPPRWADAVAAAATPEGGALADSLDQAVMGTPLRARNPMWWQAVNLLHWLLALIAIAGLLWLVMLGAFGFLQMPMDVPVWGPLPIPVLMLGGGLVLGVLLALASRAIARVGGRRRRQAIEDRLATSVAEVAHEHVSTPVTGVLDRHKQTRQQLSAAAR